MSLSYVNKQLYSNSGSQQFWIHSNSSEAFLIKGYSGTTSTFGSTYLTINTNSNVISANQINTNSIFVNNQQILGSTGLRGLTGLFGPTGSQGIQGVQGFEGLQGVQGLLGFIGNLGLLGNQGREGSQGSQGSQGIQGLRGFQGLTGLNGVEGSQGITGFMGITGVQGVQGFTGLVGITGINGSTGLSGITGLFGSTGLTGLQGIIGNQGFTGPVGNTGVRGIQGPAGISTSTTGTNITGVNTYFNLYNTNASDAYDTTNTLTNVQTYTNYLTTKKTDGFMKISVNTIQPQNLYYIFTGLSDQRYGGSGLSNLGLTGTTCTGCLLGGNNVVNSIIKVNNDIYIGGNFQVAGGTGANCLVRYNGTGYKSILNNTGIGNTGAVNSLAYTGGKIYIGGNFGNYTGSSDLYLNNIAVYNINDYSFSGLRDNTNSVTGLNGPVTSLTVLGTGVYIGGKGFTGAGGTVVNSFALWDDVNRRYQNPVDQRWGQSGVTGGNKFINTMIKYSDNSIYIGGDFSGAGGTGCQYVARWSGTGFTPLGTGLNNISYALDYTGSLLYIGGLFSSAGGITANNVCVYNITNNSYSGLIDTFNINGVNSLVKCIKVLDDENVMIGGEFTKAGASGANKLAIWNNVNKSFSPVGDRSVLYPDLTPIPSPFNFAKYVATGVANYVYLSMSEDGLYRTSGKTGASANLIVSNDSGLSYTTNSSIGTDTNSIIPFMSGDGQYHIVFKHAAKQTFLSSNFGVTFTDISSRLASTTYNTYGAALSFNGRIICVPVYNYYIYMSYDYGTTFTIKNSSAGVLLYGGAAISNDGKYITVYTKSGYKIYLSDDYGNNWKNVTLSVNSTAQSIQDIDMSADGKYQSIIIQDSYIYISSDYGSTWKQSNSVYNYWRSISLSNSGQYQVASGRNLIGGSTYAYYISYDYGNNWIVFDTNSAYSDGIKITGDGSQICYCTFNAAGTINNFYTTKDNIIPTILTTLSYSFLVSSVYTTYSGQIGVQSYNSGGLRSTSKTINATTVWGSNSATNNFITAAIFGGLSANITKIEIAPIPASFGGWGVTYFNGCLIEYSDDNINYTTLFSNITTATETTLTYNVNIYAKYVRVRLPASNFLGLSVFAMQGTPIKQSINNIIPYNFNLVQSSQTSTNFAYVSISSDGQYRLAADASNVYKSNNFGATYTTVSAYANAYVFMSPNGQYQYAALNGGLVYRSTDYGTSWSSVASLSSANYSAGDASYDGKFVVLTINSGNILVSSDYGVTYNSVNTTASYKSIKISYDGVNILATASSSLLFISNNYGVSFSAVDSSRSWDIGACMSSNGQFQYASIGGATNGLIYYSNNYGNTWNASECPSLIWYGLSSSYDGKYVFASATNGGIFMSGDYGKSFIMKANGNYTKDLRVNEDTSQIIASSSTNLFQGNLYSYSGYTKIVPYTNAQITNFGIDGLSNVVSKVYKNGDFIIGGYCNNANESRIINMDGSLYNKVVMSNLGNSILMKYSSNGICNWFVTFQNSGSTLLQIFSVNIDSNDNVYVVGYCSGSTFTITDANNNTISGFLNAGTNDVYLWKFNSFGVYQYYRRIANASANAGYNLSFDLYNNLYLSGQSNTNTSADLIIYAANGTSTFRTLQLGSAAGFTSSFFVKYDSSGNPLWASQGINPTSSAGTDIMYLANDSVGNVYITAASSASIEFRNSNNTNFATTFTGDGTTNSYIAKYNEFGFVQWVARISGTDTQTNTSITVGSDDYIYVFGDSSPGTVTISNSNGTTAKTLTDASFNFSYLVKYNYYGFVQWACKIVGSGTSPNIVNATNITCNSSNEIIVSGKYFNSSVNFYNQNDALGSTIATNNSYSAFMGKYSSTGGILWNTRIENTSQNASNNITPIVNVDTYNNVYLNAGAATSNARIYDENGSYFAGCQGTGATSTNTCNNVMYKYLDLSYFTSFTGTLGLNDSVNTIYPYNNSLLLGGSFTGVSTGFSNNLCRITQITPASNVQILSKNLNNYSVNIENGGFLSLDNSTSSSFEMGSDNYTVESWIYPTKNENGGIVFKGNCTGTWYDTGFGINYGGTKEITYYFNASGTIGNERAYIYTGTTNLNSWYHVAMTVNNGRGYAFLNGNLLNPSGLASVGTIATSATSIKIGNFPFNNLLSSAINLSPAPSNMTAYRGRNGTVYSMSLTGLISSGTVYGTNVYTDDSLLASAAVHAGVLGPGQTSVVFVQVYPGQSSYLGTTQNGITSNSYTPWAGSYRFISSLTSFCGYISNVRIVKGVSLYNSSFTPSKTPLTAVPNTQLLTCQSSSFVDNSNNNFTITNNGYSTIDTFNPFDSSTNYLNNIQFNNSSTLTFNGSTQNYNVVSNS